MTSIKQNYQKVMERIEKAAQRVGRDPAGIKLVAVSKTVETAGIKEAIEAGVSILGENYVQEAQKKIEEIGKAVAWHFIGHLQSNKVKYAVRLFDMIHSIDSLTLAQELNRRAEQAGQIAKLMIEVNISGEATKFGTDEEKVLSIVVYRRKFLHYVIQDVVERAGIEKYAIDTTPYTLEELAVGVSPDFISDQEFSEIQKHNIIWTQDQTCWEFLQSIAYADLGVFYFDKNNVFRYKAKEDLQRGSNSADFSLTEEEDIISFGTSNEIMKNAFTVNYRVPERTKDAVGLWESYETVILSSTALAANVDADDTTIPVGAIVDWYKQGYIQIDNEIIHYRNRDDNNFLECERGFLGTTAASHNNAATRYDPPATATPRTPYSRVR